MKKIISTPDVPQQNTNYDCGLYTVLFAEILLNGDAGFLDLYHSENIMIDNRGLAKRRIIDTMKRTIRPYDKKKKLKNFQIQKITEDEINILFTAPELGKTTIEFLSTAISNYLNKEDSECYKKTIA